MARSKEDKAKKSLHVQKPKTKLELCFGQPQSKGMGGRGGGTRISIDASHDVLLAAPEVRQQSIKTMLVQRALDLGFSQVGL